MDQIYKIASIVRTFTERHRKSYWGLDLCGGCGASAKLMLHLLWQAGHEAQLAVGLFDEHRIKEFDVIDSTHAWVDLPDGTILDVTATQFGPQYPEVLIAKHRSKLWDLYTALAYSDEAEDVIMNGWGWAASDLEFLLIRWQMEGQAYVEEDIVIETLRQV